MEESDQINIDSSKFEGPQRATAVNARPPGSLGTPTSVPEQSIWRAAEYVRMSTEHQQYSTENQRDKIREYAARRQIEIVRTYTDAGRSGLRIDGRPALQQLISDVQSGKADFQVILVYDVSRWGRFQDADESAYYEYICKRTGIRVAYCAEQFENDDSPVSTIVKGVKRAMAGEYSRELSAKVFAGQCRLIEIGYRQGGPAGYGLRRMLIDQNHSIKGELHRGEQKSLQTDRVILAPGPEEEVRTINRIYAWFVDEGMNEQQIAQRLNTAQVRTDLGRDWSRATVHQVLTNEKYVGNNVYNRVSFKLKKMRVVNPPSMWIRKDGAFEPIVAPEIFFTAQGIIRARARRYTDEQLIDRLRALFRDRGRLSSLLIDETDGMPSSSVYSMRFGGLVRAYKLVGFTPDRDYRHIEVNRLLRQMHPDVVAQTLCEIQRVGGTVKTEPDTDILLVNQEFTISIVLTRCLTLSAGHCRWKIRFDTSLMPDITVAVRLDQDNSSLLDYFLLPRLDFCTSHLCLADHNPVELDSYRFDTLDYLYGMAERVRARRVA
jgi:DNA invertase Pin-like site-specific DNA recombinase